ncbi:MAG: hypothetical protein KF716_09025 [Anaerolineae bacterium]|nr:hypothetical protein [Anaerolineae bacterium]
MNRSEILQKLAAGELSVDEATRLLAEEPRKAAEPDGGGGVDAPTPPPTDSAASQANSPEADAEAESASEEASAPRPAQPSRKRKNGIHWLHIEVTDSWRKRDRVRVNVPVGLVRAGLWMGSKFSHHIPSDMWDKMMDAIENDEVGTLVEVDDLESGERVHIYVD